VAQDKTASAECGNKTSQDSGTEERNSRKAGVVVTGLGVAASTNVSAMVTAEEMARDSADDGEEQTQSQTSSVDHHKMSLSLLRSLNESLPEQASAIHIRLDAKLESIPTVYDVDTVKLRVLLPNFGCTTLPSNADFGR
jgi:hypothetical protein